MSNQTDSKVASGPVEPLHVPVEGACGHVFQVSLNNLKYGSAFICPICGKPDRFDGADFAAAKANFASLSEKDRATGFVDELREFLSEDRSLPKEDE